MVRQRRPNRSCSILIWGGFLLLYAALTAIIDCTMSNGTSTIVSPLSSTDKQYSPEMTENTNDIYGSGDGPTTLSTLPNENKTTESSSVSIIFFIPKIEEIKNKKIIIFTVIRNQVF